MFLHLSPKEKTAYIAMGCLLLFGVGYVGAQRMKGTAPIAIQQLPAGKLGATSGDVTVHIVGAVGKPGVYRLPAGSRWQDALKVAGGPTARADVERVNLASEIADGDQIRIPQKGEAVPASASEKPRKGKKIPPPEGSVDLNKASATQLEQIPGIGQATAQRILELRTQRGPLKSIDTLREIRGLNGKRLDHIRKYFKL